MWLEDGSCVCGQCPGEDEHVQNEVHALLFLQDHRVCELRKLFSFLFTPFLRTFQQPNPFCCNRSTTNLFMISFLISRALDFFFFLSEEPKGLFVAGQDQSAADHPNNLAPLLLFTWGVQGPGFRVLGSAGALEVSWVLVTSSVYALLGGAGALVFPPLPLAELGRLLRGSYSITHVLHLLVLYLLHF